MSDVSPVLARLRDATADAHAGLETELDAIARLSSPADRRVLLPRYYRMHASADSALAPWLKDVSGLAHDTRMRTAALVEDMTVLELALPPVSSLPSVAVSSRSEALGFLYVLEGSSLGGRIMHKALIGQGSDLAGLSFLDPYGAETGARWRGFLSVLARDGLDDMDGVERGGVMGFAHARACLLDAGPGA